MTGSSTSRPAGGAPRQVAGPGVEPAAVDPDPDVDSTDQPDRQADPMPAAEESPAGASAPDPVTDPASASDPDPVTEPAAEPASAPDPDPVVEPASPPDPDPVAEPGLASDRDPVAEPGPVREPEPASVMDPDPVAEPAPDALEPAPGPDLEPLAGRPPRFMSETGVLQERWEAVQAGFVDDPQRAVEQADEMVSMAVAALHTHVEERREDLAETWRGGGQASTDTLRTVFQSYRELFEGVLNT